MSGKLLIVEGQDNCGKSTLISNFKKIHTNPKCITIVTGSPPINVNEEWNYDYYSEVFNAIIILLQDGYDIILDRFHIGETAYGPIYRNQKTEYIWEIEKDALGMIDSAYLVILTDDGKSILERDDGLSNESTIKEFDDIGFKFMEAYDKSDIDNKQLINISKLGWPNVTEIYNWVFGE